MNKELMTKKEKCITHHHACDYRENIIQSILKKMLNEHAELKKFTAGFRKAESCECDICKDIRKLYPDISVRKD